MPQSDFNKIGKSNIQMYGEKNLLIAGLSIAEQESLANIVSRHQNFLISLFYLC